MDSLGGKFLYGSEKKENSNSEPNVVEMEYFPSNPLDDPILVPFKITFTPGSGSPLSFVTTPVTLIFCA